MVRNIDLTKEYISGIGMADGLTAGRVLQRELDLRQEAADLSPATVHPVITLNVLQSTAPLDVSLRSAGLARRSDSVHFAWQFIYRIGAEDPRLDVE